MGKKLFVRNLGPQVDSTKLEDMFTMVGDVESAIVSIDTSRGTERRVGYVQMATEQQAQDCIDHFNGQQKFGFTLIVTEDRAHVPDPNFAKKRMRARQQAKAKAQ